MDTQNQARHFAICGGWFQLPMILTWGARGMYYLASAGLDSMTLSTSHLTGIQSTLTFVGFSIMLICMARIYWPRSKRKLITSDIFALTRHPMYHGMFIADTALFFLPSAHGLLFWASWIVFSALLMTAAWYQEQETLARWPKETAEYYSHTPRFIFEWLWFRKK